MQRLIASRRTLVSLLVLFFAFAASFSFSATQIFPASAASTYTALSGSYMAPPPQAQVLGHHAGNAQLSISMLLQPSNQTQLDNLLIAINNPASNQYHQWLSPAQFNAQFAPSGTAIAQVQNFLQTAGLKVSASSTPFLVHATGTTPQVETAFHTSIIDYRAKGQTFYQNSTAAQIPSSLNNTVVGVVGLSNAAHAHPHYITTRQAAQIQGKAVPHYGAGPGGSGLTPSQIASLYDATNVYKLGRRGQGAGATLAVFELSGYTPADITTYEHQFFGAAENVPLVDINVDGGPITPACPSGDQCNPANDFSGDVEVEADIEMQIAIAPKASRILVYNAPNDFQGITTIDEYFKIAQDDAADVISSSWGLCEADAGFAQARSEFFAFAQMALQGQSIFSASGDTGAYDCLRGSGNTGLFPDDPSSQPFVTAVGGTSFETFDPGTDPTPAYPQGVESVWNVGDLCNGSATGLVFCANLGAGGGGVSTFWGRPFYQSGPGVISSLSQKSPFCQVAFPGQYCREVPDVSANADEFTPYAEYCTGNPSTNSTCATFSSSLTPPGWFGIGGTSLSSPLWSGIIGLWDSVNGFRFGLANVGLYALFRTHNAYSQFYHDITGQGQAENNNGFYPTTPYYDMATGIGTPRIAGIVIFNPRYGIY